MIIKRHLFVGFYLSYLFLSSCINPEKPKFELREGLVFVDAYASTEKGASYVIVSESGYIFSRFGNNFSSNALVSFRNTETNTIVELIEEDDIYLPPEDFNVSVGESWELLITLANGKSYQSLPEVVIQPVEFSNLKATYKPDLVFREDFGEFVPGHILSLDINDPLDEKNFYYWQFRSFEAIDICKNEQALNLVCDSDCWRIRYNENIKIFSDEFNKENIINVVAADVLMYSKANIVVEIQQYSLSEPAYNYFKVLKNIIDNNSGVNAPPAAALIGNMFNPNDDKEFVLGRFTAASTITQNLFIDRSDIVDDSILPRPISECFGGCLTPCSENRYRTAITPEGWQD